MPTLAEVLPAARALTEKEQVDLVRQLRYDMETRRQLEAVRAMPEIEIWSPFDAVEAAVALQQHIASRRAES